MQPNPAPSEDASTPGLTNRPSVLALVTVCFFLSGVASLTLEVVWTRELRLVFGSTTLAASTILVAYMLGLGLGGVLGGKLADRLRRGVRVYGWIEVAIGVYALVVPFLLARLPAVSRALLSDLSVWQATLWRFALSLLVLILPTILMGATLPILVAALVRGDVRIGERTGLLYGLNTLGAVIGVFLSTFVLFPMLGLQGTNLTGAFLDIGVGLLTIFAVAPRVLSVEPAPVAPAARRSTSRSELPILISYALVGFSALVYEVAWTRALAMVLGSSLHAFAAMLAAFLTGIGIGSLVTRRWIDRLRQPSVAYAWGILTVGALSLGTMLVLPRLPGLFVRVVAAFGLEPAQLVMVNFSLAAMAMLPPTLVFGALFPLVVRVLAERTPAPGEAVGRVYFANTLGSAAGAFAAGFLLIPTLGLRDTLVLASIVNLVTAAGLLLLYLTDRDPCASRSPRYRSPRPSA